MGKNRDYWAVVARRAWREALEHSKLHKVSVALFTLVPSVVAGLGAWMKTGQPTWTTVFTLIALVTMTCLGALLRLATVPPKLAEEARFERGEIEAKLASYSDQAEDATISEGLAYVLTRQWDQAWELPHQGIEAVGGAVRDVVKLAHRGKLHIWGRSRPDALHTVIPAPYWERQGIDIESLLGGPHPPRTTKNGPNVHERYHDPMINRAEFEREWPKPV